MSDTPTNRQQAEAAGFTVDRCCYPWVAYKGPRFQPTELHYIDTDREAEAERQRDELADVLRRSGFVPCDIAACNCGSWHHRYGLPERWKELTDIVAEAGHPLANENGNLLRNALRDLIAERNKLAEALWSAVEMLDWVGASGEGSEQTRARVDEAQLSFRALLARIEEGKR